MLVSTIHRVMPRHRQPKSIDLTAVVYTPPLARYKIVVFSTSVPKQEVQTTIHVSGKVKVGKMESIGSQCKL